MNLCSNSYLHVVPSFLKMFGQANIEETAGERLT